MSDARSEISRASVCSQWDDHRRQKRQGGSQCTTTAQRVRRRRLSLRMAPGSTS